MTSLFLVLNAGSSSLKAQMFKAKADAEPALDLRVLVDGIGNAAKFVVRDASGAVLADDRLPGSASASHDGALMHLVAWFRQRDSDATLAAVGHRVVHGGDFYDGAILIDDDAIDKLETLVPLAPLHQPHGLAPIRAIRGRFPHVPQVACFDTAFHLTQSDITRMYALPASVRDRGVKRYGFHGLSYDYIASRLGSLDPALAKGRVVVAHLGNGASLCALAGGKSVATTMGFSALDGLAMGTRCGTLDPAVVFYMLREMKLTPDAAESLLYKQSGLLGVSELSNDMRVLREAADTNPKARQAIDLFVYRAVREIGSLVAALGGIDGIVFTAGIGENDPATRSDILQRLGWLGFRLDPAANAAGGPRISTDEAPSAWVVPTDEEIVILRQLRSVVSRPERSTQSVDAP